MAFIYGFLSLLATVLWIYYLTIMIRGRGGCGVSKPCGTWTMPGVSKRKKKELDPLDAVNDPKEAAVLLMIGMAECEGIISSAQKQKILDFGMQHFQLSQQAMSELYSAAGFLLKNSSSLEKVVSKMAALLNARCTSEEKQQVINAMQDTARADGGAPNADQLGMVKKTAEALKLTVSPAVA